MQQPTSSLDARAAAASFGVATASGRNDSAAAPPASADWVRARHHWNVDNDHPRLAQYAFCVWPDPSHCAMRFAHWARLATFECTALPCAAMVRFLIDKDARTLADSPSAEKNGDYRTLTIHAPLRDQALLLDGESVDDARLPPILSNLRQLALKHGDDRRGDIP